MRKFLIISLFASIFVSIGTHAYLVSLHVDLKSGVGTSASALCSAGSQFSCHAAAASSFSEFLGVPMALWGLLANFGLLLLTTFVLLAPDASARTERWLSTTLVAGIIAFTSIVMILISYLFLSTWCPFCILTYLTSFVAFATAVCLLKSLPEKTRPNYKTVLRQIGYVSLPLFFFGFIIDSRLSGGLRDFEVVAQDAVNKWKSTPSNTIAVLDPIAYGASKEQARFTIVEFADFRCSHCRDADPVLKAFVQAHSDVRLEFQTYALDGACNPQIPRADGAGCLLAQLTFCAQKLNGRGMELKSHIFSNQKLFFTQDGIKSQLPKLAEIAGVTVDQLSSCAEQPEMKKLIENQASLGNDLGVTGTPTVFVNGKKLELGHVLTVLKKAYASH